jgi:hypothetical protein
MQRPSVNPTPTVELRGRGLQSLDPWSARRSREAALRNVTER